MNTYSRPHYEQARRWHRFARILRQVRHYAYARKEDALTWSLDRKTHGFAVPADLECLPEHSRGLFYLRRQLQETRFPELEAKARYDEAADVEHVELFIHHPTRRGTDKIPVGYLPDEDARWVLPLLRENLPLRVFVCAASISLAGCAASVTVAIARPDTTGRQWIDVWSDRKEARAEGWTLGPAAVPAHVEGPHESAKTGSRVQVVAEPTVEDWLREDIERREVCLSDLPASDYWQVATRL